MDVYNLINSNAISKHCRKLKYQFNTLEIAVLIYRNRSMSIEEKIKAYNELIENYEDMPFVEHFHCGPYESTKDQIKKEIQRLEDLQEKLILKEEGYFYTATTYWQDFGRVEADNLYFIKDTFEKTYNRVMEDVNCDEERNGIPDYVTEFRITKRAFDSEYAIIAKYIVIDKKPILNNIIDSDNDYPDFGTIYLYMPTPFKKGDLLYSRTNRPFDRGYIGKDENVFVLKGMHSWYFDNIQERARNGKGDNSDMNGDGYFINYNDVFWEIIWDYDSWEYFEGKLTGMQRILRGVSEMVKGEMTADLLFAAYNKMKFEAIQKEMCTSLDWFIDEGLKGVGFNEEDIKEIKK